MKKLSIQFVVTLLAMLAALFAFESIATYRAERHFKAMTGAALVAEGLNLASRVKRRVAEHYSEMGRWPSSNWEARLAAPEKIRGRALESVRIVDRGVIVLTFNEDSGVEGGTIRLTPDTGFPLEGVEWRCTSPSFEEIAAWIPRCTFVTEG